MDPQAYVDIPQIEMKASRHATKRHRSFSRERSQLFLLCPWWFFMQGSTATLTFEPSAQPLTLWNVQTCENVAVSQWIARKNML